MEVFWANEAWKSATRSWKSWVIFFLNYGNISHIWPSSCQKKFLLKLCCPALSEKFFFNAWKRKNPSFSKHSWLSGPWRLPPVAVFFLVARVTRPFLEFKSSKSFSMRPPKRRGKHKLLAAPQRSVINWRNSKSSMSFQVEKPVKFGALWSRKKIL